MHERWLNTQATRRGGALKRDDDETDLSAEQLHTSLVRVCRLTRKKQIVAGSTRGVVLQTG